MERLAFGNKVGLTTADISVSERFHVNLTCCERKALNVGSDSTDLFRAICMFLYDEKFTTAILRLTKTMTSGLAGTVIS